MLYDRSVMVGGATRRIAPIAAVLLGGLATAITAPAQVAAPRTELLPDLIPFDASELSVTGGGRLGPRRLRLGTSIVNAGPGPMEIAPARGRDCNRNGRFGDDELARQRIYVDGNGDRRFHRLDDDSFVTREAGCVVFHAAHDHWHLSDFARYELVSEATGRSVASSTKVSFCITDLQRIRTRLPGRAFNEFYGFCDPEHPQGLSIGWFDTYDATLPGQFVSLRGVPDGRYCLRITVDRANRLSESREGNNRSEVAILLRGRNVRAVARDCRP